jgi:O-antigen ligase
MNRFYGWALPVVVVSPLITPSLYVFDAAAPEIRIGDIVVAVFVVAIFLSRRPPLIAWGLPQKLLLGAFVAAMLSLLVGTLLGFGASIRDVIYVGRLLLYAALFTLVASAVVLDSRNVDRVLLWLGIGTVGLALLAIQQYWNLLGLNRLYVLKVAPNRPDIAEGLNGAVGMTGGPNEFGFMAALLALCMLHATTSRRRLAAYLPLFGVACFLVILSGSRGAAMGLGGGIAVYGLVMLTESVSRGRGRPIEAMLILALVLGIAVYVALSPSLGDSRLEERFSQLSDPTQSPDLVARQIQWKINFDLFARSPIVGVGPLTQSNRAADNEWLLLLRSYGIIGTILIASALLSTVLSGRRTRERTLALATLGAATVYMIPGAVISSVNVMPLFVVGLAAFGSAQPLVTLATQELPSAERRSPAPGIQRHPVT